MNPLGTRSRVEELARLLEGAVAGPGSLTAGHAALALRLRAVAPGLDAFAAPRPEFRAALRQRLVAVATVQAAAEVPYAEPVSRPRPLEAAVTWTQTRKAQRRIGVTAGAMAGVIAFTGVGIAASRSLPGQPFYGLKRAGEGVELRFTSGDTAKGTKHLEFAATRLREVGALAHGDGSLSLAPGRASASGVALGGSLSSRIADALSDFDAETNTGRSLLESVYRKTGKPEPLRILKTFSSQQQQTLTTLLPGLPEANRDSAQSSLDLVTQVGTDATQMLALGTCGGECYPGNGGPTLPTEPVPTPGATAAAPRDDNNNVPPCTCQGQPSPTPAPAPDAQATDPASPEPQPTASPAPRPSSRPTASPGPLPTVGPVPTGLPTSLPTILPTIVPLPSVLPTSLLP